MMENETCVYTSSLEKSNPSLTDLGKRVTFVSGNDRKVKYGTLRYFGKPEFSSKGSWCGVELDEPKGKNNGSVQGIRYFSCPHECGIFVPSSKVELDPIGESRVRARTSVTSLVEKRARKMGTNNNRKTSPFFYNTMPYRSLSIPALDQAFSLPADKCEDKRTTFNDKSKQSPLHGPRTNHISPLKKYTSEMNLKIEKTNKVLNQQLSPSNRHIMSRRPLGSFSEMPPFGKSLRNSISCNDLSLGCPPKASIKKFSLQVSPAPIDTDDGLSCYSSTSDLSHGESDTDITPHSSSTSPCFIDFETTDTKLALKPPNRVPLPTGLATPTTTLIESSRNNKECKITSPDHQKPSKIYQNGRTITPTLEHPLVNGLAYDKDAQDNKENNSNNKKVFICPNSGQQIVAPTQSVNGPIVSGVSELDVRKLQDDITTCLKQQVAMEARMGRMENNLLQFQSVFITTMDQVQDTLKKLMLSVNSTRIVTEEL